VNRPSENYGAEKNSVKTPFVLYKNISLLFDENNRYSDEK
jgi:hypothetical protein